MTFLIIHIISILSLLAAGYLYYRPVNVPAAVAVYAAGIGFAAAAAVTFHYAARFLFVWLLLAAIVSCGHWWIQNRFSHTFENIPHDRSVALAVLLGLFLWPRIICDYLFSITPLKKYFSQNDHR